MSSLKLCAMCGEGFRRDPRYDDAQWEARRFCSRICSGRARAKPLVLCACGCGQRVLKRKRKYIKGHRTSGRMTSGYIRVFRPDHPLAARDGHVLEHRMVLHDAGVDIPPGYHVHHVNGRKDDNRLENLEVVAPADHHRGHARARGYVDNQYGRWAVRA